MVPRRSSVASPAQGECQVKEDPADEEFDVRGGTRAEWEQGGTSFLGYNWDQACNSFSGSGSPTEGLGRMVPLPLQNP